MSNKARSKRGRYKYDAYRGNIEKKALAEDYYNRHKKKVDAAVNVYRKDKNIPEEISNQRIFETHIIYGRDFGSKKQANKAIDRLLYEMRGGDPDWYDAKHGSNKEIFGDLRKMNKHKPVYVDYNYTSDSGAWEVEGYYETTDPDIVIAKIRDSSQGSPFEYWEYTRKDEIGL